MGGTAPLTLVHNRPVVTLDDGGRAVVDTAGAAILLSQDHADALDLTVVETVEEQGEVFTVLEAPALSVGGYELDTDGLPAYGFEDTRALGLAASGLDLLLPATLLQRHAVVLDGVAGSAWFGDAGTLRGEGVRLRAEVAVDTGLVTLDVGVHGGVLSMLLDTGVSCSLAAARMCEAWTTGWPDLPTSAACVGPGNMAGLRVEARTPMIRVSEVEVGGFTVPGVAFVWRGNADIAPFDGTLGGNVLRYFKLGLDLARGDVWVEQRAAAVAGGDADQVGVTLVLDDDAQWEIAAAVVGLREAGIEVGDRLESVDGQPVAGVVLPDVLGLLAGEPGVLRHLVLRRVDGALVEADAPCVRVL